MDWERELIAIETWKFINWPLIVRWKSFRFSKNFSAEERYSLTDQIRRASRSVCSNLAEAWRKRIYKAVFVNKISDSMQEGSETQTWLDFCIACGYINEDTFRRLDDRYEQILAMLNSMEMKADKFCYKR